MNLLQQDYRKCCFYIIMSFCLKIAHSWFNNFQVKYCGLVSLVETKLEEYLYNNSYSSICFCLLFCVFRQRRTSCEKLKSKLFLKFLHVWKALVIIWHCPVIIACLITWITSSLFLTYQNWRITFPCRPYYTSDIRHTSSCLAKVRSSPWVVHVSSFLYHVNPVSCISLAHRLCASSGINVSKM